MRAPGWPPEFDWACMTHLAPRLLIRLTTATDDAVSDLHPMTYIDPELT
jgi:hypothetical protein